MEAGSRAADKATLHLRVFFFFLCTRVSLMRLPTQHNKNVSQLTRLHAATGPDGAGAGGTKPKSELEYLVAAGVKSSGTNRRWCGSCPAYGPNREP